MAEIEAQLRRAQEAGLNIGYLDEHMGVGWLGGLRQRLAEFTRHEGLVEAHRFSGLPAAPDAPTDWIECFRCRLAVASTGAYVLITHPGFDRDDLRRFHGAGHSPGEVARQRDAERRGLTDPRLSEILLEHGVELTQYTREQPRMQGEHHDQKE